MFYSKLIARGIWWSMILFSCNVIYTGQKSLEYNSFYFSTDNYLAIYPGRWEISTDTLNYYLDQNDTEYFIRSFDDLYLERIGINNGYCWSNEVDIFLYYPERKLFIYRQFHIEKDNKILDEEIYFFISN